MSKLSSLALLVNSLNKGEKRYLRLYSNLQQGTKDYLFLFDCLEKNTDLKEVKKNFISEKASTSFDVTCSYLYKLILESVLHIRTEKDVPTKLTNELLKSRMLFEKGLYDDGFKLLDQIQTSAARLELPMIQLWALTMELDYISSLNFHTITEAELVEKQMKIQGLLKYHQHFYQHNSLYQLLQHRLLYKGGVRTKEQQQELNDLLMAEVSLVSKPFSESFESKKSHLLFQAYYFITVNDYNAALQAFYELNQLFEDHQNLWVQSPMDYLLMIEGILDSLHTIKKYKESEYFMTKLEAVEPVSGFQEITIQRIIFTYSVIVFLDKGDFAKALAFQDGFKETLFKRINLLDLSKQAELYLYSALIHIGLGDMEKAHMCLNKILFESRLYYTLPVYRTFRLIHLLVHFEMGNHDYIKHEVRSIKRSLTGNHQKAYLIEKIIFKFVLRDVVPSSIKERTLLWEKTRIDFDKIISDKYEIQLLKIFNFSTWIESRLMKKSFAALLEERYQEG